MRAVEDKLLAAFRTYLAELGDEKVEAFVAGLATEMPRRAVEPARLPVLCYLDRAAQIAPLEESGLVRLLAKHRDSLRWGQTYAAADFGATFLRNYGWTEVFGTRGPFASERVAGGFLLLGPQTAYPDHHHVAEEIYVPLTPGGMWRKGEGDFTERRAGEVIHHPSDMPHAMRTGGEPLLALYLWRGGDLAQKSAIVDKPGRETTGRG